MAQLKNARVRIMAAQGMLPGEPARALPLFEQVAALAARRGRVELEADAELGLGECLYLLKGREGDSLQHFRRAAELAPGTAVAARARMGTGDVLRFFGDDRSALAAYSQAVELFIDLQDAFGECQAQRAGATLLIEEGRGQEALPHLARAAFQASNAEDPGMAAELTLMTGELLLRLERRAEAVPALRAAAQMYEELGERQHEMRARMQLADALASVEESNPAVPYGQVIRLAELMAEQASQEGDAELEGTSQLAAAQLLAEQAGEAGRGREMNGLGDSRGVNTRQLTALAAAAAAFARAGNRMQEAGTHLELAMRLSRLGHDDAALAEFRRVRELSGEESPPPGRMLLEFAHVHIMQGLHEQSLHWFEKAARWFKERGDASGEAEAEAGRLETLGVLQRWDQVETSRQVIGILDRSNDPRMRVPRLVVLRYQAQALFAHGDYAGAVGPAIQAADLAAELGDPETEAQLRLLVADSSRRAKRLPDAPGSASAFAERMQRMKERAEQYARAAALFDANGAAKKAGRCWYQAAYAYSWLGLVDPGSRELCYDTCCIAADRLEAAGDWWGKGLAELCAGQALRKDNPASVPDPRNTPMLRRAVDSFARAGRPVESAVSMITLAVELARTTDYDAWMAAAISGLRRYEQARPSLQLPDDRARNDSDLARVVQVLTMRARDAVLTISDNPQCAELVWLLEQTSKARSFQDQRLQDNQWNSLVAADEVLRHLVQRIERLTVGQDASARQLNAELASARTDQEVQAAAEQWQENEGHIQELRRQVREHLQETASAQQGRIDLISISPPSVEELQACLNPSEAYLGYLWNGGRPLRSMVTPDTFSVSAAEGIPAEYAEHATDADRLGESLYATGPGDTARLLGPIPDNVDTLIISPDRLLVGLPWQQLPCPGPADAGQTLGDRYTIAIVPAAGVFRQLRTAASGPQPVTRRAAYLGVACDGRGSDERPLECADGEVEAIARDHFPDASSACLTTPDCSKFLKAGCSVRLLHLACHADLNGLLLSQDGTLITPIDLFDMPGRTFSADVLLLTGCYAGDFSAQENNEFPGIVRQLLLVTGARAAIVSVAAVPDAAAPVFADLVVSALTGRNPGRPWRTPEQPLAVGPAVAWARQTLSLLCEEDVAPLIPRSADRPPLIQPESPRWWSPWFVLGDPRVTI